MPRRTRWLVVSAAAATLVGVVAAPAFAIYPRLNTALSGPAINGVVPTGSATVDQSKLPAIPLTLAVQVSNVNLPGGTILSVVLTDCGQAPVGTIKLGNSGEGQLKTKVPAARSAASRPSTSITAPPRSSPAEHPGRSAEVILL